MREEERSRVISAGFQMYIPKLVEAAWLVAQVQTLQRHFGASARTQ